MVCGIQLPLKLTALKKRQGNYELVKGKATEWLKKLEDDSMRFKIKELRTKEMKAITIAHLTGQMAIILEMIEFNVHQINMKDYQIKFLMEQINEAKVVNDEIFELHKRNELNRIKKIYNNGSDEDE